MPNIKSQKQKDKKVDLGKEFVTKKQHEFDLSVKVQSHRLLSKEYNKSSLCDLPTCQISKPHMEKQKSYSLDTSLSNKNRNLTMRSKFKVIGQYQC